MTAMKAIACTTTLNAICPKSGVNTFLLTKLAVGLFADKVGYGPVQPMNIAIGRISNRSMYKNWKSPRFDADAYKKLTDVNWMAE